MEKSKWEESNQMVSTNLLQNHLPIQTGSWH